MSRSMTNLGMDIQLNGVRKGFNTPKLNDWHDDHKIPMHLALIHSEVSEAVEAFRNNDEEHFGEELADIIIRTLDLATGLGLDIDFEVKRKMALNAKREYKHGGKRI